MTLSLEESKQKKWHAIIATDFMQEIQKSKKVYAKAKKCNIFGETKCWKKNAAVEEF